MIFVTVGTHEQQFDRLVEYMDKWASMHDEKVIIQTGYSVYEPKYCVWKKMFSYEEMNKKIQDARIVITHGGPSSIIAPLQIGKIPIVVPREKKYSEHVNNHQVIFCKRIESASRAVIVYEINKLGEVIDKYNTLIKGMNNCIKRNNNYFCTELSKIVCEMFED